MIDQQRPETPRATRGVSSWALNFYARTGDYVAAWSRLAALAWSVVTGGAAVCAPFFGWRVAAAAALAALFCALHVWLGFFYLANPEWTERPDGDA
jgi:hypothetical protein